MEEGKVASSPPTSSEVEEKKGSSEKLRGNLVEVAVKFLNNPRVVSSSLEQKTAFLKKKGLTENEVAEAIKLAAASSSATDTPPSLPPPPLPPRPLSTPHTLTPTPSRSWRDYAVIAAVVGGVGYTLYQLVQHYVLPWLKGPREERERLEEISTSVRQLQSNLDTTISTLNETTKAIRDSLSEQQEQMRTIGTQISVLQVQTSAPGSGLAVREIREEIATLKGLLLNRHQFPPTPTRHSVPGIPSWQRTPQHEQEQKAAATNIVEEGSREEGGGGGGGGGGGEEKKDVTEGGRGGGGKEEGEGGGGGGEDSGSQDEQD